jgi:hypothetical protein
MSRPRHPRHVLQDAIIDYVKACGGRPTVLTGCPTDPRVEDAIDGLVQHLLRIRPAAEPHGGAS